MVGSEPDEYRPRRAHPDPAPSDPSEWLARARSKSRPTDPANPADPADPTDTGQPPPFAAPRDDLDLDDSALIEDPREPRQRTRLALMIAAVTAVVIVGLALGYAALSMTNGAAAPPPAVRTSSSSGNPTSPSTPADVLLSDSAMLSAQAVKQLDPDRTWRVALTQRGLDDDAPSPACLTREPAEGSPTPQQTVLRLLSSNGKNAPGVLHQAEVYPSAADATQAFSAAAKIVGDCAVPGAHIESARSVTGLGDQALGVVVRVSGADGKDQVHSLLLNRTGRIVDVTDAAAPESAPSIDKTARVVAAVTASQCKTSGGACPRNPSLQPSPPPPGNDEPGFLTAGDLPSAGPTPTLWVGDQPAPPNPDFTGSQCERVDWARVAAQSRIQRTYLQQDGSPTFGLDEIIVTAKSSGAAEDLVQQVKGDLDSCAKRKLTASVTKPVELTGVGAEDTKIRGWAATVTQKATSGSARYRVGIASAGSKVVFTFLNPQDKLDVTDKQWQAITVRAAERATQLN